MIGRSHVKGPASLIKVKILTHGGIAKLGKTSPGHPYRLIGRGKVVRGHHPKWAGLARGFCEYCVHSVDRVSIESIVPIKKFKLPMKIKNTKLGLQGLKRVKK